MPALKVFHFSSLMQTRYLACKMIWNADEIILQANYWCTVNPMDVFWALNDDRNYLDINLVFKEILVIWRKGHVFKLLLFLPILITCLVVLGKSVQFCGPQFLFPRSSAGKESAFSAGDQGSIPGSGRSHGKGNGNPVQYFCLENGVSCKFANSMIILLFNLRNANRCKKYFFRFKIQVQ